MLIHYILQFSMFNLIIPECCISTAVHEQAQLNRACNICNFVVLGFLREFLFSVFIISIINSFLGHFLCRSTQMGYFSLQVCRLNNTFSFQNLKFCVRIKDLLCHYKYKLGNKLLTGSNLRQLYCFR